MTIWGTVAGTHPLRERSADVRALCKRVAAKAGVGKRVHPYGLRHGWALAQVQSGTSLNAIQHLFGHGSLHTTSAYLQHIAPVAVVAEATAGLRT